MKLLIGHLLLLPVLSYAEIRPLTPDQDLSVKGKDFSLCSTVSVTDNMCNYDPGLDTLAGSCQKTTTDWTSVCHFPINECDNRTSLDITTDDAYRLNQDCVAPLIPGTGYCCQTSSSFCIEYNGYICAQVANPVSCIPLIPGRLPDAGQTVYETAQECVRQGSGDVHRSGSRTLASECD